MTSERVFRCAVNGYDYDDHDPVVMSYGQGPRDAAVAFAERECMGDPEWYAIYEAGERVTVREEGTGKVTRWVVEMDMVPHFRAMTAKGDADGE